MTPQPDTRPCVGRRRQAQPGGAYGQVKCASRLPKVRRALTVTRLRLHKRLRLTVDGHRQNSVRSRRLARCLLFGQSGSSVRWRACEVVVDLASDVVLEATHDVELEQALFGASLDIGPGRWVAAHADQSNPPKALLARRSPPRLSRWRSVRPEDAGMGAAPHRCAKAASERSRCGSSPAVTSSWPAVSTPTPGGATSVGATEVTSAWSWVSSWSSSAWSCCQRRARIRRVALVAAVVLVSGPGRRAAQARTSALVLSPSNGARNSSGRCTAPRTAVQRPRSEPSWRHVGRPVAAGSSRPGPHGSWGWWRPPRPGWLERRPGRRSDPTCPGAAGVLRSGRATSTTGSP
jgi:hypothetical protein